MDIYEPFLWVHMHSHDRLKYCLKFSHVWTGARTLEPHEHTPALHLHPAVWFPTPPKCLYGSFVVVEIWAE